MSDKRSPALGFIFITILIDVIGLGIIIPVVPKLIRELTGEGLSRASEYSGWLTFAYAAAQFCCAPVVGGLSDKLGRRPVLVVSTTTDTYTPEAAGDGLMQNLLDVGLSARQRLVDAGPLPLAALAGPED